MKHTSSAGIFPLTILPLLASSAAAFQPFATPDSAETAAFDEVWKLATLYKNESNPIFQEFKLRGRYHGQNHWTDADAGDDEGWEDRRSRFGFDAKLFEKKLEARFDFQSNDEFEDVYDGLVDAYLRYKPDKNTSITVGRTKPLIGYYDFLQSTNSQPTFERSQIFNQLNVDRASGITAEGKVDRFTWQAGLYSNSLDTDRNDLDQAFGTFNAGWSATLGAGYDAKECLSIERADFRIDWLHSEHDADDNVLARYDDIVSFTFWAENNDWGLVTEAYGAFGGEGTDGDVFGFFIQPTYDVIPGRLQLVSRYSFAAGDGADSVRAQNRYEVPVGAGRGDQYHAIYGGVQYFIHGDKLKLLAGAEYATLDGGGNGGDYDGTTYLAGARFSF